MTDDFKKSAAFEASAGAVAGADAGAGAEPDKTPQREAIGYIGAGVGAGVSAGAEPDGGRVYAQRAGEIAARSSLAASRSGRSGAPTVIAVSKTVPKEEIAKAFMHGINDFGENRPQELAQKCDALKNMGIFARWHMIGRLQTNKVKLVVGRAVLIHSIDRAELAEAVSKRAVTANVMQDVLLEINVGRETQKAGFYPEEAMEAALRTSRLPNVRLVGLMTVAPFASDPNGVRWVFWELRKLFLDIMGLKLDNVEMKILSMGMSGDFEVAVEEGSNMVRIGRAIFGSRHPRAARTNEESSNGDN